MQSATESEEWDRVQSRTVEQRFSAPPPSHATLFHRLLYHEGVDLTPRGAAGDLSYRVSEKERPPLRSPPIARHNGAHQSHSLSSFCRRPGSPSQQGNRLPASYHSLQDRVHHQHPHALSPGGGGGGPPGLPPHLQQHHHHLLAAAAAAHHAEAEQQAAAAAERQRTTPKEPKRAFDVSSLIGETAKSPSSSPPPPATVTASAPLSTSPKSSSSAFPSPNPNLSVGPPGPPQHPPAPHMPPIGNPALYPYLLQYQQQLAAAAAAGSAPGGLGGLNPMLLNAQLALAAQHNPLLAAQAYANSSFMHQAAAAAERLRQSSSASSGSSNHRFSPYPTSSPPRGSPSSPPLGSGSAFHPIQPKNSVGSSSNNGSSSPGPAASSPRPGCSPAGSRGSPTGSLPSPSSPKSVGCEKEGKCSSSPPPSDLKSMENLINGLKNKEAASAGGGGVAELKSQS